MRTLCAAVLLVLSAVVPAQDAPKPLSIAVVPLGDRHDDVMARVYFRFANPREITEAGLFLEGSFRQPGQVPRNFRYAVPRKGDKLIWSNTVQRNRKVVDRTSWAVLPDQRNEMTTEHRFFVGEAEIEARLVLEGDRGRAPATIAQATETFTFAKTNRPYLMEGVAAIAPTLKPEVAPEAKGPVAIRGARPIAESGLFEISVDVRKPVRRVEFWVEGKKVLARNAAPYLVELYLGESPRGITVRAIGFDAAGRYVDADALVVTVDKAALMVKITRTETPDGMSHFKMSVRNPSGASIKNVILYAGDKELAAWERPPYTLSVPTASLAGVNVLRAVAIDADGVEARDVQPLARK
jgi:hypothetical protein